jgi:hypothetical protein
VEQGIDRTLTMSTGQISKRRFGTAPCMFLVAQARRSPETPLRLWLRNVRGEAVSREAAPCRDGGERQRVRPARRSGGRLEDAAAASRYTIAVLTPSYIDGGFEDFHLVMSLHHSWESGTVRFIPILRRACRLPLGVRMTSLLDLTRDRDVAAGLRRLAAELRTAPQSASPAGQTLEGDECEQCTDRSAA